MRQDEQDDGYLDVTEDMLNMFVRLDVQRRFFNICSIEVLAKYYGMKEPSSLDNFKMRQTKIPLQTLIENGRSLTIEEYFEVKDEFERDKVAQKKLIRDRETFLDYGQGSDDSE